MTPEMAEIKELCDDLMRQVRSDPVAKRSLLVLLTDVHAIRRRVHTRLAATHERRNIVAALPQREPTDYSPAEQMFNAGGVIKDASKKTRSYPTTSAEWVDALASEWLDNARAAMAHPPRTIDMTHL